MPQLGTPDPPTTPRSSTTPRSPRPPRSHSAFAVLALAPLLMIPLLWVEPQQASAQTPYQAYQDSLHEGTPGGARGGVRFEMARAGGLLLGQKRGVSAGLLAGGLSMFTLELDGMMMWHRHGGQDHRAHQVRIMAGITAVELYDFAAWRLELGLVFGERLRGERGYTEFGLGSTVSLPLMYGPDGWPLLRLELGFGFAPVSNVAEAFRLESTLSVYPFVGTSVRALGLQGGYFWGQDLDEPYHLAYFGLIYGAPLG